MTHADVKAGVGVNWGFLGDNQSSPSQVVSLLQSRNIKQVRFFEPRADVLSALQGSGISVILGTRNEDLPSLASDPSFATQWVQTNVVPFASGLNFRCIAAGNEVIRSQLGTYLPMAMQNLDAALKAASLAVPVSTSVPLDILATSYPPSMGSFTDQASSIMTDIAKFLDTHGYPLLANVYPYFAYAGDQVNIRSDYALFTDPSPSVTDGNLHYSNLFDAMVDSLYAALEKVGSPNLEIVVSESGWPSDGNGEITTPQIAQTYDTNLISHVTSGNGTPRRPNKQIESYIFGLFNENQKPEGVEQHWGLFNPDMTEVYHVDFP
ncbi:Glycoside hydrolase family 17 [Dillenia turbinata]|uniref:Glycoside hydrolase family 17 n=1 Tax=Dillenia turbinata TaxID=194707 RepID=A0AAN8ZGH0_9MAGN